MPRPEPTDAELLRRSRSSSEAFRAVYDRHAGAIHAFLARRTGDGGAALELTAETFAEAWRCRGRFEDRAGGSAAPWLFGIARNVLAASARRRELERGARDRLGLTIEAAAATVTPDDSWTDGLDADLEQALGELGASERRAVELRVLDDLDYGEVGRELGISPGAARVRVSRGLARLRRRLTTATSGGSR
jgi:RNA polymerase sigma-70 factor, ECF subfamily